MNTASSGCACPRSWPRLYAVIDGVRYPVEPTLALTASSALFRAWCAGCGAEYPHPFRIDLAGETRAA